MSEPMSAWRIRMPNPRAVRGGALSLLLALVALGAILYFALSSKPGVHSGSVGGSDSGNAVNCEPLISALVRDTGGAGAAAQAAYDQLPAECRKLLPSPASLAPSPERAPDPT